MTRPPDSTPPWPAPADHPTPLPPVRLLDRLYTLLNEQLANPRLNVDWLAKQLTINRKTLYRTVRRQTQLSPTDLIRQYRLHQATRFLKAGYTITQTAAVVGFKTASHFTTVFKAFYRQTPTDFIAGQAKNA